MNIYEFWKWFTDTFSYGYGTGEQFTIPALRTFFINLRDNSYDYQVLEKELTPLGAWLLIDILCGNDVDVIEYGTSPRFAWLTKNGQTIKDFVLAHSDDALYELVMKSCYEMESTPPQGNKEENE